MWKLSQLAEKAAKRPSEIVGIDDEWAAYQFDQAVVFVGVYINNKLNEIDDKGKHIHSIGDLLADRVVDPASDLKNVHGISIVKHKVM